MSAMPPISTTETKQPGTSCAAFAIIIAPVAEISATIHRAIAAPSSDKRELSQRNFRRGALRLSVVIAGLPFLGAGTEPS